MHKKTVTRQRRAKRTRMHIRELGVDRLSVHRTPRHIYAQVVAADGSATRVAAATIEQTVRSECDDKTSNCDAARVVGRLIAERAQSAGIERVAFDRSGFAYHGRVKALADAARENGLKS